MKRLGWIIVLLCWKFVYLFLLFPNWLAYFVSGIQEGMSFDVEFTIVTLPEENIMEDTINTNNFWWKLCGKKCCVCVRDDKISDMAKDH